MNYYVIIPFMSFLMEAFTCIYIFAQGSKNRVNKAYLFLAGGVAIWALAHMIIWTHDSDIVALYILKYSPMWSMAIGFWFLNFTYVLINKKRDVVYYSVLTLLLITIIISITTDMYAKDVLTTVWGRQMVHGPIFLPSVFFVLTLPMLYGLYLIVRYKKTIADPLVNKQFALIITGIALSLGVGLVLDVIVPFVLGFSNFIQLGTWVFLFHTIFIFIAITKYRFFKIGLQEAASDLFSNIRDGIIILDNEGNIIQINKAIENWIKSVDKNFKLTNISKIKVNYFIKDYQFEKNYYNYETSYIDTKGERDYMMLNQSTIYQNNYSIGKILIFRNITRRKEAEEQLKKQKEIIEQKNKALTDSIIYAKRIQQAVLPPEEYVNKNLPDHFILFKPKETVSGDFYWAADINDNGINKLIVATCDCTGHGVSGAFMSMLGISILNEIVIRNKILRADLILNELRKGLIESLHQTGKEGEAREGMDMTICVTDTIKQNGKVSASKLLYSGAYNPLYLIRNGELSETKANRMPVGIHIGEQMPFTNHEIKIEKGDIIYTFSDGYYDQQGGVKGRKFLPKQFKELLLSIHKKPLTEQKTILDTTIDKWRDFTDPYSGENFEQMDDILVIGMRF